MEIIRYLYNLIRVKIPQQLKYINGRQFSHSTSHGVPSSVAFIVPEISINSITLGKFPNPPVPISR